MGNSRLLVHFCALVMAVSALVLAVNPASATALGERACTLSADMNTDLDAALTRQGQCRMADDSLRGPRIWAFVDVSDIDPAELQMLIVDPSSFDSFALYLRDAEGNWTGRRYGSEVATQNWRAGMRFALSIEASDSPVTQMAISFDRPMLSAVISHLAIQSTDQTETEHYYTSLFYAIFIGVLLLPMVYNISFFITYNSIII